MHKNIVKDTVTKFPLSHSSGAGIELSKLIGGPTKATIKRNMKKPIPVLDYFNEDNIEFGVDLLFRR